jgi:RNA polymerase subunit RPABC4/transcription elongation factor Spt4
MASKQFDCDQCESSGKITVKSKDITVYDIGICPVCGSPLLQDEDDFEEEV